MVMKERVLVPSALKARTGDIALELRKNRPKYWPALAVSTKTKGCCSEEDHGRDRTGQDRTT